MEGRKRDAEVGSLDKPMKRERRKPARAAATFRAGGATAQSGGYAGAIVRRAERDEMILAMAVSGLEETEGKDGGWRGAIAVPPGSPVEKVLLAFRRETDIPLEIPFFAFLHFTSGLLLKNGSTIQGPIGRINPELWTVVLAPSGSGKTWATSILEEAAELEALNFGEPASGAAFLEALADKSPALWTQDEIAQKLKQIEDPKGPLAEAKEYLLRTYDNKPIERKRVRAEPVRVEKPVLGIFGLNTPESFKRALSAESVLDGFAQRFGFVYAEKDPDRPMWDFPIYDRNRVMAAAREAFEAVQENELHAEYVIGADATQAFQDAFEFLGKKRKTMPESFFRRAMFRALRYAVLYHVILGKPGNLIDAADIGWGARAVLLHLNDLGKIIGQEPEVRKETDIVGKAIQLQKECRAAGKPFTARVIQQRIRAVGSADQAKAIYDMVKE